MNVFSGLVRVGIAGVFSVAVVATSPIWGSYLAYVKIADKISERNFKSDVAQNKVLILPKLKALFADSRSKAKSTDIQALHDCAVDKTAELGAMYKAAKNYDIATYRHSVSFEREFVTRDEPKEISPNGFGKEFKESFHDCAKPLTASRYTPEDIHALLSAYTKAAEVYSGRDFTLDRPEIFAEEIKGIKTAISELEVDRDSFEASPKGSPFGQIMQASREFSKTVQHSSFGLCVALAASGAYTVAEKDYKFSGGPFRYEYQPYDRDGNPSTEQARKDQAYAERYANVFNETLVSGVSKCENHQLKGYDYAQDYGRVPEGIKAYALSFKPVNPEKVVGELGYFKPKLIGGSAQVKWLSQYVQSESDRLYAIEMKEKSRAYAASQETVAKAEHERLKAELARCGTRVLTGSGGSYCINSITGERTYNP